MTDLSTIALIVLVATLLAGLGLIMRGGMRGQLAAGGGWWRLLPRGASSDAVRILTARGVRAFADGFVALLLPIYLVKLGFSALAVGTIVTSTLNPSLTR